jgi:cytochrome c oxidase subunit II
MNSLLKIIAVAAAFGLTPAALAAAPQAAAPNAELPAQPQVELPAQPVDSSTPPLASEGTPPSDAEVAQTAWSSGLAPEVGVGQPDGRLRLQDQYTPIGESAAWFHNWILMPAITIITIFVLILMIWVIIRYRRRANPVPSRTSHNTLLEVVWTAVPVLILVVIAVPSIRLLSAQYSPPEADLTVKVIGNQWYWTYEYPDHGIELISNMLSDEDAAARGEPRQLAVDERLVVPEGATVKLIVTSADVIHSFGVPAFWVKMDAVPGRLNETWFRATRPGIYYGQCYELCGARHAYMPIAVEVVPAAQFAAWVGSKGGTLPGAEPEAAEPAVPAVTDGVTAGDATETSPAPAGVAPGTGTPPVSTQGATNSRRGGNQ